MGLASKSLRKLFKKYVTKFVKVCLFFFNFFCNFQNDYKDDKVVLAVSVTLTICLALSFVFMCLICRRKSRERAKKRHFARLVSDLNATEKFTLVTPSDEEDNSD